ncbi:hypothetical protein DSECCO2_609240 [anaerobic digester metagenome]
MLAIPTAPTSRDTAAIAPRKRVIELVISVTDSAMDFEALTEKSLSSSRIICLEIMSLSSISSISPSTRSSLFAFTVMVSKTSFSASSIRFTAASIGT